MLHRWSIIKKIIRILFIVFGLIFLIILLVDLCLGPGSGFVISSATRVNFIDLSADFPKEKKTGIELVSIKDGKASVRIRGTIRTMKEGDVIVGSGSGRIQLIYISEEDGEIILERMTSGPKIRSRVYRPGDKSETAQEILKRNGQVLVFFNNDRKTNSELRIELISIVSNGVTMHFPGSEENIYAKSGGFFKLEKPIEGISRIQLLHVQEQYNNGVALRVISDKKSIIPNR